MKTVFKAILVVFLMAISVVGFETARLNSVEKAIDCILDVLYLDDIGDVVGSFDLSADLKPSGTYYCGTWSLEFRSNGTVISNFLGLQEKGTFSMDGSEITYSGGGMESVGEYDSEKDTVTFAGQTYKKK